eukprot:CAMPEP_0203791592 /NCGR_PEP_ID=MMETSP0100_2-20121128/4726_1 /ASSEMBLY_ACC=CAM_ASM_000210 /TAXON_ID=96639 /ORGANISM=" , Strain NY0313808BC1" /LENGTH=449 /DNA_ID=CAMNT_0050694939 /DNA_START=122 /DNA_END=1468 /DNA_ORIENTATION=+
MLFLIFPKEFEKQLFLASKKPKDSKCPDSEEVKVTFFSDFPALPRTSVVGLRRGDKQLFVMITHVDESDIGFNIAFNEYLREVQAEFGSNSERFTYVLCGTCGGSKVDYDNEAIKTNLGSCFIVDYALKFDRGHLDEASYEGECACDREKVAVFNVDRSRTVQRSATFQEQDGRVISNFSRAIALSSNFLMRYDPRVFSKDLTLPTNCPRSVGYPGQVVSETAFAVIAEMETFDFFALIESNRLHATCLRVISDIPDLSDDVLIGHIKGNCLNLGMEFHGDCFTDNQKICRKTLNMYNLLISVWSLGEYESSLMRSGCMDPYASQWINARTTLDRQLINSVIQQNVFQLIVDSNMALVEPDFYTKAAMGQHKEDVINFLSKLFQGSLCRKGQVAPMPRSDGDHSHEGLVKKLSSASLCSEASGRHRKIRWIKSSRSHGSNASLLSNSGN